MSAGEDSFLYGQHQLPVLWQGDCCVMGGGTAGTAAAIAAGRGGAAVLLVERGIALGGMQTQGQVTPCMDTLVSGSATPFVQEVEARLQSAGIATSDGLTGMIWTNPEQLAAIYDELAEEAGVDLLYNAVLVDAVREEGHILAAVVQTVAGLGVVRARVFIDATGDALLSRLAGVPTEQGSPRTGCNQPMSFRFVMGGIDIARLQGYIQSIHDDWCKTEPPHFEIAQARHRDIKYKLEDFFLRGVDSGELTEEDVEYMQAFTIPGKPGCMSFNCPELPVRYRATEPFSYSEGVSQGRRMMRRLVRYMQKYMPGFESAYLAQEAAMLGARESWRICGRYQLTEADYYARRRFTDAVARTAWYIDAHGEKVGEYLAAGEFYEIPYRSLVAAGLDNLLAAGRCISASFIVEASLRIQPTCMSIGEAAGIAAAWALTHDTEVAALAWDSLPAEVRSYISAG